MLLTAFMYQRASVSEGARGHGARLVQVKTGPDGSVPAVRRPGPDSHWRRSPARWRSAMLIYALFLAIRALPSLSTCCYFAHPCSVVIAGSRQRARRQYLGQRRRRTKRAPPNTASSRYSIFSGPFFDRWSRRARLHSNQSILRQIYNQFFCQPLFVLKRDDGRSPPPAAN